MAHLFKNFRGNETSELRIWSTIFNENCKTSPNLVWSSICSQNNHCKLEKLYLENDINKKCSIILCNENTINIKEKTRQADILIVACGKSKLIKNGYIKYKVIQN